MRVAVSRVFTSARNRNLIVPGILAFTGLLGGCANPEGKVDVATSDNAFISYWGAPTEGENPALRLAVKDLIDVKGSVTTAGSEYLAKNSPPATRDAACLAGARAAGAEIVGKTNVTEFAVAVSGINGYFGTPRNPLARRKIIPGGSSSGSAVAVANGMADVAYGTDTAGSIRVPAACVGILGLKTTYGLVPVNGVFPISPTHLDTVGPMARDIPNLVKGMAMLQGGFTQQYRAAIAAHPTARGLRVGRLYVDGTNKEIDQAIDSALISRGFTIVKLGPEFKESWVQAESDGRTIAHVDAWLSDREFIDKPGVTPKTRTIVATGATLYPAQYQAALERRLPWQRTLASTLRQVDFVALPVLKQRAPKIPFRSGVLFESRVLALQNTVAANLAGNPALAIPIPVQGELVPGVSLQLIGPRLGEAQLVNAARIILGAGEVEETAAHNLTAQRD